MNFEIHILSSATGSLSTRLNQSAQYLKIHNSNILVDCGEVTQFQIAKFGLSFQKIEHIFISHLHADHYVGLIGLINTMNLNHREKELNIYCPEDLKEIIDVQLKKSGTILRYKIIYHFTSDSNSFTLLNHKSFIVRSIPLKHRIQTTGFVFKEKLQDRKIDKEKIKGKEIPIEAFNILKKGRDYFDKNGNVFTSEYFTYPPPQPRVYAYITDTLYHEKIIPEISGADILYHESTFDKSMQERATERFHSTTIDAATIAKKAKVKKLILGHISTRFKNPENFVKEAQEIFPNTEIAEEGKRFTIGD
ncbi:MAG: ribonuclease Z [Bacteroidota bacterium]|nr:ribonuclease Z [Bacteroidota bacterium]